MAEQHPSGRPIRPPEYKRLPIYRRPRQEFVAPRLNQTAASAIGFYAQLTRDGEQDDRSKS